MNLQKIISRETALCGTEKREYLFRGKCIDETCLKGQWLEGDILHDGVTGKYYIHKRDNCLNESDNVGEEGLLRFVAYEVDPETICQCIGLTDKNGRKIFEGDVLSGLKYYDWGQGGEYEADKCIIKWYEKRAAFDPIYWWEGESHDLKDYEVIGNIFDNPELKGA